MLWGSSSWCQSSRLGCLMWGSELSLLWENLWNIIIFQFVCHLPGESEKTMATHSSTLACRISGTGEPGGLPSVGSHRVEHDWSDLAAAAQHPILRGGNRRCCLGLPSSSAAAAAKSLQSCSTLCDPIDGSPPGPAVPGVLQARTLEWIAIS